MKKINFIFLVILGSAFFIIQACDKVDPPYKVNIIPPPSPPADSVVQKVLLEEYTGHTCGNCPPAAHLLNDTLKPLFGVQLIVMSVHANFFAEPCPIIHPQPPNSSPPAYSADYRCPAGEKWYNDFVVAFNPNGMVNRIKRTSTSFTFQPDLWAGKIDSLIKVVPKMSVKINNSFNSTSKTLTTTIDTKFLQELTGDYKLVVCITEDNIFDWQEDYYIPQIPPNYQNIPDYRHRHVLRGAINGDEGFGELIATGTQPSDYSSSKTYLYNLNASWNASNCSVVAFVYKADTREIVQAEEAKVQ